MVQELNWKHVFLAYCVRGNWLSARTPIVKLFLATGAADRTGYYPGLPHTFSPRRDQPIKGRH